MLLKIPVAAQLMGLSRAGAYRLAARDALPGLRKLSPRQFRVSAAELYAFIHGTAGQPEQPDHPRAA